MKNIAKHLNNSVLKKILITVITLLVLCLVGSCRSTKTKEAQAFELEEISNLVNDKTFEIENMWAFPLRGSRIDLIGNPNFLRIKGDSANVNLPYFGVRQFGGGYGDRGGIIFNDAIKDVKIEEGKNGKSLIMNFKANQGNEDLQFYITIFPNNRTDISVNSSQRDAISYQGTIKSYKSKDK